MEQKKGVQQTNLCRLKVREPEWISFRIAPPDQPPIWASEAILVQLMSKLVVRRW
jgi:hypothetical protein